MKHFTIIGDNHYALSMILESLEVLYGTTVEVQIIFNRDQSENDTRHVDYKNNITNVHWKEEQVSNSYTDGIFLAGMSPESRLFLVNHFKQQLDFSRLVSIVHPSAQLSRSVELDAGTRIEPLVVVAPFVKIGMAVLINRQVSIGHHTTIKDYCNINPGAIVNGNCILGEGCTIGSGAIINDGVNIGAHTIIGSGSVVTKDIPENVIAFGNPTKVIKPRVNFLK